MRQLGLPFATLLASAFVLARLACGAQISPTQSFFGCCDGSAVVALDESHFVIANDEDSVLRIYDRLRTNAPVWQRDFSSFLQLIGKSTETDLEGAARIGDVIYWIGSHSRNVEGKERPNRQRLFATRIMKTPAGFELEPHGKPCRTLLPALITETTLAKFKLAKAAELPPEKLGGLDIEGLAATPNGGLFIAFRNPMPEGKALIVPLENPSEVIEAKAPRFGEPVLLDFGNRGVRDITLVGERYFVMAGGAAKKGRFDLFEWNGPGTAPVLKPVEFGRLSPEGVTSIRVTDALELLFTMDDGNLKIGDCDCKDLADAAQRRFRVMTRRP